MIAGTPAVGHGADYRRDIDGLRAVAILLVLLYHFDLGVSGGFVGVDVFFVISGFLITGIIHRQAAGNAFSFLDFYERRARRILPALMAVLAACTIAALVLLLPSDLKRFGASVGATLIFVSNFFFWSQGSYFGPASELAPLLHTWSLSVEEQFYLAMPPLYLLLRRFAPNRIPHAFAFVTLVSLAGASYFILYRAHEVFYWTPFRVWELAIGGWLAVAKLPSISTPVLRNCGAALGIALILAAALLFNSTTPFPGYWALLPCVGAALVIWAGMRGNVVSAILLANRPMVFVGLISYSLYLWHWPMMAFARNYYAGDEVPLPVRCSLIIISVVLAYISWKFVETPFRSPQTVTRRGVLFWGGLSGGAAAGLAALMFLSQGLPARFSDTVVALDSERGGSGYRDECMNLRGKISIAGACTIGAPGDPTVLFWGDSYAQAMLPAMDSALRGLGLSGAFLGRRGCPPLPGTKASLRGRSNWKCSAFNDEVISALRVENRIDTVIVAAAWNPYVDPKTGYALEYGALTESMALSASASDLERALATRGPAVRLVIVKQVPVYPWNVPYRMAISAKRGEPMPSIPRASHATQSAAPGIVFDGLSELRGVGVVNPEDWFCDVSRCQYADKDGRPYYLDHGHLNRHGAAFAAPRLMKQLGQILELPASSYPPVARASAPANQ